MLTVNRKEFYNAVALAKKIVPSCSRYNGRFLRALLTYQDDALHVQATDGNAHLRYVVPAKNSGYEFRPQSVSVKELVPWLGKVKTAEIAIDTAEVSPGFFAAETYIKLDGGNPSDHPAMAPMGIGEVHYKIPFSEFQKAANKTTFATEHEGGSRYALENVQMIGTADKLEFRATDGHRLALTTAKGGAGEISVLIEARTLDALASLKVDGDLEMHVKDEWTCTIKVGPVVLHAVAKQGIFPKLKSVIPTCKAKGTFKTNAKAAAKVLRANPTADHHVKFEFANGQCNVKFLGGGFILPGAWDGQCFQTYYQPQFVLDLLEHTLDDEVSLDFGPDFIRLDTKDQTQVVMSCRG